MSNDSIQIKERTRPLIDSNAMRAIAMGAVPTDVELRKLLNYLLIIKGLSREDICSMLSLPAMMVDNLLRGQPQKRDEKWLMFARLIWMLWILDVSPLLLLDAETFILWGRGSSGVWLRDTIDDVEMNGIVSELRRNKEWSIYEVCSEFNISPTLAARAAELAKVRLSRRKSFASSLPKFARPGSIWLEADWNKNDLQIAKDTDRDVTEVKRIRSAFKNLKTIALEMACLNNDEIRKRLTPFFEYRLNRSYDYVKPIPS